ncbi:MAG TPA: tetratricopeptide repeat protein, partial [Methylococcus sp.]|nr:tetratricopeptide repeat protein [Methylococcus sp.]
MLMRVLREFCFPKHGTAAARPLAGEDLREAVWEGYELYRAGKRTAAERVFRKILECDPRQVDALCLLAEIHLESGREKDAIRNYQTALRYRPDIVAAWLNLARLHARRRSFADLVRCLIRLEEIGGHDADVWNDLGVLWLDAGNWDRAAASFRAALAQDADHARALCNLGLFAQNQGELTSALALLERAVALAPACAEAQNNYGLLLRDLGRPREALQPLARAIAEKPDFAQAHANYAVVCQDLGRFEEAAEAFDRALALAPESGDLHLAKAHFLLSLGCFREGWEAHEHRLRLPGSPRERFPFPEWDGRTLDSEETLLVCAEQGIGDEILFASCIPDLRKRAERVIVECDPRLEGLFQRSFPGIRFVGKRFQPVGSWLRDLPSIHRQVALGSLPRFFRNAWDDFPRHGGYLIPDVDRMRRWKERLDGLGPGLKIGLSWRGGT